MLEIVIKRTICFSPMLLIATEKLLVLWISYWSILRNQLKLHRYHNYKRSCSYITKISLDISVVNFKFLVKLFWLYMKNSTFWNNATKLPKQTFQLLDCTDAFCSSSLVSSPKLKSGNRSVRVLLCVISNGFPLLSLAFAKCTTPSLV